MTPEWAVRRIRAGAWLAVAAVVATLVGVLPLPATHPALPGGQQLRAASSHRSSGVTIVTVPPVAGFPVILDGVVQPTDAQGRSHFAAPPGNLGERLSLNEAIVPINGRNVKVDGSRIYRQSDGGDSAQLVLDMSYLVQFDFTDMKGAPVDASVIKTVTVKSVTGAVVELPAHEQNWLQGSRVVPLMGGLEVKKLDWTVQNVEYSGSNVVNASQQKFLPADQADVTVKLLFYRVQVALSDALFGFSQKGAIDLAYPDGRVRRFDLDEHGRLTLPALPRGNYTITSIGPGPKLDRPLALSRNQVVDLSFYSWLDIGAIAAVLLVLALGLPLAGRRRRRKRMRRTARGAKRLLPKPRAADDESTSRPAATADVGGT